MVAMVIRVPAQATRAMMNLNGGFIIEFFCVVVTPSTDVPKHCTRGPAADENMSILPFFVLR